MFFFSSRRRHTSYIGDWSSDVCSSDLPERVRSAHAAREHPLPSRSPDRPLLTSSRRRGADLTGPPRPRCAAKGERSEERRVGKEGRARWLASQEKKGREGSRAWPFDWS